jgi:two-component system response regulator DesR
MKVLLADDSDLILERLKEMLCSFEQVEIVASLKNGIETLDALRILKPDLAIVDVKMPGLSGLEVLKEIRKEDKTTKFIVLTLYSSDYYRQLAELAGADYFFSKADDFDKVSFTVADMIMNSDNDKNIRMINLRKASS